MYQLCMHVKICEFCNFPTNFSTSGVKANHALIDRMYLLLEPADDFERGDTVHEPFFRS